MVYHDYFCIHYDIFDIIQSTLQDNNIMLNFISNEPNENEYQCEVIAICDENIKKKKRNISKKSTKHTIQRKRHHSSVGHRNKSFDDFRIIIVDPTQELDSEESDVISSSFGVSVRKSIK